MTDDIDECIDAIMSLQNRKFLFTAGYEFDLSDDHSMFRIRKTEFNFKKYFNEEDVEFDEYWADRLNF